MLFFSVLRSPPCFSTFFYMFLLAQTIFLQRTLPNVHVAVGFSPLGGAADWGLHSETHYAPRLQAPRVPILRSVEGVQ
jgi:hypothetical protein